METEKIASSTIFVVEDDESMRQSLSSILRSVGYKVELFESGYAFMSRAKQGLNGCIILDVRLPGPSGLEIQRRLVEAGVSAPVIFITGHGDISMAVEAMKANAVEFLTKPFRAQSLLDAISEALDRDRKTRIQSEKYNTEIQRLESLTNREFSVLENLLSGKLNKQIAYELKISEGTVKVYRRSIMKKLCVENIIQMYNSYGELLNNKGVNNFDKK